MFDETFCRQKATDIHATHFATDGPAPRRYDGDTAAARVGVAVFVRSEYSNALVGDGVPQPAPRSSNLDSAFGGMQLFAPEAWRAASLLLTHSAVDTAYCAAATAVTAMGSPSLALSHLCCGLCERHCSATAGTL